MEIEELRKRLNDIYAKVPTIQCKQGCHECCGPIFWFPAENASIFQWLKDNTLPVRRAKSMLDMCPYIEGDKCLIYPVRPLICRLFGVVKHFTDISIMECPFVNQDTFLTEVEARKMMDDVLKISEG